MRKLTNRWFSFFNLERENEVTLLTEGFAIEVPLGWLATAGTNFVPKELQYLGFGFIFKSHRSILGSPVR
jgi:hypothetical protein